MAGRLKGTMPRILPPAIICVVTGNASKCAEKWQNRRRARGVDRRAKQLHEINNLTAEFKGGN